MANERRSKRGAEWFLVLGGLALLAAIPLSSRCSGGCGSDDGSEDPALSGKGAGRSSEQGEQGRSPTWASQQPSLVIPDDDVQGGLRLEGQVLGADEMGVGGATVVISSNPPRTTETEDDGSFFFEGLIERSYMLKAMAPEGTAGPATVALRENTEPVILRLRAGARIEVDVVDAASEAAIAQATVGLRGLGALVATADDRGKAVFHHVAPGRYEVVADAPGYAPEYRALVVEGESAVALDIALHRGVGVSGVVLTPDGEPAPGAMVYHEAVSELAQGASSRLDAVATDASGRFELEAMRAGSFRFLARHRDYAPGSSEIVRLDGKHPVRDIEIRLEAGAVLRARVQTKDGAAVSGALVRVAEARDNWLPAPTREAHTDAQGEVELRALPRRRVDVTALHDTGSSDVVAVDLRAPPHDQGITLVLAHTGTIAGVVEDPAGEPVEGAQVTAQPKGTLDLPVEAGSSRLRGRAIALTDAGGRFTLSGLSQGEYELRASRRGVRSVSLDSLRAATLATTGDTGVRLVLASDGGITGRVVLSSGGPPGPFLVALDGALPTPVMSRDGRFTLGDVPPGTYTLAVRGAAFSGSLVKDVVVASDAVTDVGTITVGRRSGRNIAGVVLADGEPVPGALVMIGHSIMSDGESIKMQGSALFGSAREAVTDDSGRFSISGLRRVPQTVIAEHPSVGRSDPIPLAVSPPNVDDLVLELHAFGALRGRVSNRGEPVSRLNVGLQSMAANGLQFSVRTGSDGSFRFDKLAPGSYKLSAMFGDMGGMRFHGRMVTVRSDETTEADIDLDKGELSLTVRITATNAASCRFAWINVVGGVISPPNAAELSTIVLRGDQGFSAFAVYSDGAPAVVRDLGPGTYTVCAIPFPAELSTQSEYSEYHERAAESLPVVCQPVDLQQQETSTNREITLEVEVPPFVSPPAEE